MIPKWMDEIPIAHRGFFDDVKPENSLAAFKAAVDEGFAIELDVQLIKDGTLVVFHDTSLKRMTGYDKNILECTYDELRPLQLNHTSERIPTFKEVLDLVDGKVPLMVEFKNDSKSNALETAAYELLKNYKGDYIIQSFNPISVHWFKVHAPHVIRGQLSCRHKDSQMSYMTKFLLRNLWTNVWTKPHFVIYDIDTLNVPIIKWIKFRKKPLYGYTAKTRKSYENAKAYGVLSVFEGFNPKE